MNSSGWKYEIEAMPISIGVATTFSRCIYIYIYTQIDIVLPLCRCLTNANEKWYLSRTQHIYDTKIEAYVWYPSIEFEFVFLLPFCLPKISMFERSKSCFDRVTDRDGSQCSARFVFADLTTAWENSILFKLFGEYMVVTLSVVMAFLIKWAVTKVTVEDDQISFSQRGTFQKEIVKTSRAFRNLRRFLYTEKLNFKMSRHTAIL